MSRINCKQRSPKEVSVIIGTLLESYLGDITYDTGESRKAVSIGKPHSHGTVSGVEMIVSSVPKVVGHNEYYMLYFLNRDDKSQENLYKLFRVLKNSQTLAQSIEYLPANSELDSYEQVVAVLPYGVINHIAYKLGMA